MPTVRTPTLDVGDVVELDDSRYVVDKIRSVVVGKHKDKVTVYDLEAINPGEDTLHSRSVSEVYISYRLDSGTAAVSSRRGRLINRVRRLFERR